MYLVTSNIYLVTSSGDVVIDLFMCNYAHNQGKLVTEEEKRLRTADSEVESDTEVAVGSDHSAGINVASVDVACLSDSQNRHRHDTVATD